jgi:hypothetical protein
MGRISADRTLGGRRTPRDTQRGSTLALTLILISSLMALGTITVLNNVSELKAGAQSRFTQEALYAAESGASAALEFLRDNCSPTNLFSAYMSPANATPAAPIGIVGNNIKPPATTNPFVASDPETQMWYSVTILNNVEDEGYAAGTDKDGRVILRSTGYGRDGMVQTIEMQVEASACVAKFCEREFAQRGVSARNDSVAACSAKVTSGNLRSFRP